jgi:hypothetical protein
MTFLFVYPFQPDNSSKAPDCIKNKYKQRREYSQEAESEGAMLTPNADVMPNTPKIQTARLLIRPPHEPAANTKLSFFAKLSIMDILNGDRFRLTGFGFSPPK